MSKGNIIFQCILFVLSLIAIVLSPNIITTITVTLAYYIVMTRGEK